MSIQVDMHDRLALALQDDLTERIVQHRAHGVLIDISALEIVDSFIGRMIGNIAAMARILDAQTVVVGMRPAVAITLVELGAVPAGRAHRAHRGARHGAPPELLGDRDPEWSSSELRRTRSTRPTTWCGCGRSSAAGRWSSDSALVDQTKVVTAASEIARNTVVYGGGSGPAGGPARTAGAGGFAWSSRTRARGSPTSSRRSRTGSRAGPASDSASAARGGSRTTSLIESRVGEGTRVDDRAMALGEPFVVGVTIPAPPRGARRRATALAATRDSTRPTSAAWRSW